MQIKCTILGFRTVGQASVRVAAAEALLLAVGTTAIAVLTHVFAVVLLGSHLSLKDGIDVIIKFDDVVGTVLALPARVRGAQLKVNELLVVHAFVVVALFVVVVTVAIRLSFLFFCFFVIVAIVFVVGGSIILVVGEITTVVILAGNATVKNTS